MSPPNTDARAARFEEPPLELEVLLIYQDEATGLRGMHALGHVFSRPEMNAEARLHVWRLDVLRDPACQAEATQDALQADIMVVSMHSHDRLAPEAEAGLKQWVALKRSRPCSLVVSLGADAKALGESHPALLAVRSEAARNGLTVLLQYGEAPRSEPHAVVADIPPHADTASLALKQIPALPEPHTHWGLNE